MDRCKIYTVGKMSGTSYEKQMSWRTELEQKIEARGFSSVITFIQPPKYFNYDYINHQSEREIKEWELHQLSTSDIVIVNLENINDSVGSHFEIATADYINSSVPNRHIFILGYGKCNDDIHPWIKDCIFRFENNMDELVDYICKYLLI